MLGALRGHFGRGVGVAVDDPANAVLVSGRDGRAVAAAADAVAEIAEILGKRMPRPAELHAIARALLRASCALVPPSLVVEAMVMPGGGSTKNPSMKLGGAEKLVDRSQARRPGSCSWMTAAGS